MTFRRTIALVFAAAAVFAAGSRTASAEEKSLLAPNGTVYTVRAGSAADLGIAGPDVQPEDTLLEWTSLGQDGKTTIGVIPNTASSSGKGNLDLAYDEQTKSLVLLWREEFSVVNLLHLSVLKNGSWSQLDLLPNLGIAHAYNPKMLLTHQVVHWLDADGKDAWKTRSLLSVIWWEEGSLAQARYAPIFLDEDTSANDVPVYDLPDLVESSGPTPYGDLPAAAYSFPSLQLEGPGGNILASFADLASAKQYVIRLNFPTDLGKIGSLTSQRRRIPVFGIAMQGPLPNSLPTDHAVGISTMLGASYNPTLVWSEPDSVKYIRFDAATSKWSAARSIALTETMSESRARALVQEMATRN